MKKIWSRTNEKIRFLITGFVNTAFGVGFSIWFYYTFKDVILLEIILLITVAVPLTFSFITNKIFVFKGKSGWRSWILEYLRSYAVYGTNTLVSLSITYVAVKFYNIEYWLIHVVLLFIAVAISYVGHKKFTFR